MMKGAPAPSSSPESKPGTRPDQKPNPHQEWSSQPTMPDLPNVPDVIDRAKAAVSERAELPGMSLFEHLDELRKRIIHAVLYLAVGYVVAVFFAPRLYK